jgi:hypothetical protein
MKMVKSLLLGSAAGFVAVAGAQAADLPVKAKAANPVLICSLYGKGFYYIPGSDMCLSITGFTRFQTYYTLGGGGGAAASTFSTAGANVGQGYPVFSNTTWPFNGDNGFDVRTGRQNDFTFRTRWMMTFDARQQTAYGTLRSVATAGVTNDLTTGSGGTSIYANRAFIQIAGFTLGKAVSFFDSYANPAYSYYGNIGTSDTGDGGQVVAAYTAQFGGGVSATISAEEPRRVSVLNNAGIGTALVASGNANQYVQYRYPDIVGALRWDQPWGTFQVNGALHDVSGGYYGATGNNQLNNGHPSDAWGYAVGAGLKLRFGADVFDSQFTYTEGALKYISTGVSAGGAQFSSSGAVGTIAGDLGYGLLSDGVYGTNVAGALTSVNLTTGWAVNAAYDHRWSPALKTSVYGGYVAVRYNGEATGMLCSAAISSGAGGVGLNATLAQCGQNWQQWFIGSRTQWDVARSFYVGVDVLYTKLETANRGLQTGSTFAPGAPRVTGIYNITDQDAWAVTFRAHRDIVP